MKIFLLLFLLPSLCIAKDVDYSHYSFSIPDSYSVYNNGKPLAEGSNAVHIVNESNKGVAMVELVKKGLFPLDEYEVKSLRELFYILYSNVPSDNKAVTEFRAMQKSKDFKITERNGFVFYRVNHGDPQGVKVMISTPLNDELLGISFDPDEALIKSVIDSLKIK
ncbi:MAG: hypothetical protein L3J59_02120 [Methylococcaceae bacterium]|nr:hypothetical protein [Methylococcaceae bacterium]